MRRSLALLCFGVMARLAAPAEVVPVAGSPVSMLPEDAAHSIAAKKPQIFSVLEASGTVPKGFLAVTPKPIEPVWHGGDSSVETTAPVAAGDLLSLVAAVRGVSRTGEPKILVKLQGNDWAGLIRGEIAAGGEWRWVRLFGRANKDRAAGELRLHFYPAYGCQAFEVRGLRLENWGRTPKDDLPPLPESSPAFGGDLPVPPALPPDAVPVVLEPLSDADRARPRRVMLKLDDVSLRTYRRYDRVIRFLEEKGIVAGLGVIVSSLDNAPQEYVDWLKRNALENGGRVEFWNHGWDHAMDGKTRVDEFKGSGLAHQRENLAKSQDVFRKKTGLSMCALGTAGNSWDADTSAALAGRDDIRVWLYGNPKSDGGKRVLKRTFNLEHSVGRISFESFAKGYAKHRLDEYAVIQGHPNMWNDQSWNEFKKIVEQLIADGWKFSVPRDFTE